MGQEGCRVYHCCRHTMVSNLKLDYNEVPRAFVQMYRRSVLPKSLRTHPDHTPHVDLSSLFVHPHKQLSYILCFVYPSIKNTTFLKMSSISHPATVFLFLNLSCTRNLTKPHCFGEENENFSQGHSPRTPFLLQTPHKHPNQLRHWCVYMCVCACVCACVRALVYVCVCFSPKLMSKINAGG